MRTYRFTLAIALGFGFALASANTPTAVDAFGSDVPAASTPVGSIEGSPITAGDVQAQSPAAFTRLRTDYERERRHLEREYAQRRHALLERELGAMLDQRALAAEAKTRGVSTAKVLEDLPKSAAPTPDRAQAFYRENESRIGQPFPLVQDKILAYLADQDRQAAQRRFYDALRLKHGIVSSLAPFRVAVRADGPSRGPADAPVTIVEFGDFQCPYCKAAEKSLAEVRQRHAQSVRVVFRNLPLEQIHPNARTAAQASVCADRQGKFWEMHDAMYADQAALDTAALSKTAARLGMDEQAFTRCLADESVGDALARDAAAADDLGLTGTPFFFINGRPVDGNVPEAQFETLVTEELRRSGRAGG